MLSYQVEIKNLDQQIQALRQLGPTADRRMKTAMQKSVLTLTREIKPLVPVFRGALRNSIGSEVIDEGAGVFVGRVGTSLKDEEYPAVMNWGRRPGQRMPPPSALTRWVHLKLGVEDWKAYSVALQIARKIAAKGIKGRHFLEGGYEKSRGPIKRYFEEALRLIAEDLAV